jgi:hypothetical protein
MQVTESNTRTWTARLSCAFWLALILFAAAGLLVMRDLPPWLIALVVGAGVVLGALLFLPRWLVKRRDPAYSTPRSFIAFALTGVLAAMGLVSLLIYYLAFWVQGRPTAVPLVTVSNGRKTVVFQGMQHVGSEGFYKSVVFDLEKALNDGYTLFYEGVKSVPGRPDLTEWFNKTLRGSDKDIGADYTRMADTCGLQFQLNYFQTLAADMAIHPARHVTADVSYGDMKTEYDRLMREDPAFSADMTAWMAKSRTDSSADEFAPLVDAMAGTTSGQKKLIGIVCRGVLGMATSGTLGDGNNPINRIILDFRNRALARFVAESTADKIYITYGAAHFLGFFAELQRLDPGFSIRSIKGVRSVVLPDEPNLAPSAVLGAGAG